MQTASSQTTSKTSFPYAILCLEDLKNLKAESEPEKGA